MAVFQRLPQHLEDGTVEFGQLVKEQHPVVCKADFTWGGVRAATDHRHLRDGVVRTAERSLGDERSAPWQLARHRVYLGRLQAFAQGQRREDGRQTLGHHRLAAAWRAHHDDIVSAGGGDFEGTLDTLLPFHLGKVEVE